MNMIVLVLVMAVTVEALVEYAKTFGKAIIEKQWKTAATQAVFWCWSGLLRRVGCELQRGVDWNRAYGRFCQSRRELCIRSCEEVASVGRGEN